MKHFSLLSKLLAVLAAGAALALAAHAGDMPMSGDKPMSGEKMGHMDMPMSGSMVTVTGEVLDMACYLDHGASGEKHADCAKMCISSGLPVGLKSADGMVYLLIGEHKPANADLTQYAAKTITVKGKFVSRDGINLLENIEVVK
ncbi:MAG TPA: hypothetical protein VLW52_12790 [Opitutaceae bacterium]|nr:hypothetical protein [Opitutaceae bacterium]